MCNEKYSRRFIEALIDSFLTEEIIPDILINVFSGAKFLVSIMAHTFVISFVDFIHHSYIENCFFISFKKISLLACVLYFLQDISGHQGFYIGNMQGLSNLCWLFFL